MIKYFCDKCNKQLVNYDIFTVDIKPPEIRQYMGDDMYAGTYILCKNCIKEFHKWLTKR